MEIVQRKVGQFGDGLLIVLCSPHVDVEGTRIYPQCDQEE